VFTPYDLVNVPRFNAYVRLLIDNTVSKGFSMATNPPTPGQPAMAQAVKQLSRLRYGRDRAGVEAEILERTRLGSASAPPQNEMRERVA
jgi:hypothetical protein